MHDMLGITEKTIRTLFMHHALFDNIPLLNNGLSNMNSQQRFSTVYGMDVLYRAQRWFAPYGL